MTASCRALRARARLQEHVLLPQSHDSRRRLGATTHSTDDVVVGQEGDARRPSALSGGSGTFDDAHRPRATPRRACRTGSTGTSRRSSTGACAAIAARSFRSRSSRRPRDYAERAESAQDVGDESDMQLDFGRASCVLATRSRGPCTSSRAARSTPAACACDLECRMHHEDDIVRELGDDVESSRSPRTVVVRARRPAGVPVLDLSLRRCRPDAPRPSRPRGAGT